MDASASSSWPTAEPLVRISLSAHHKAIVIGLNLAPSPALLYSKTPGETVPDCQCPNGSKAVVVGHPDGITLWRSPETGVHWSSLAPLSISFSLTAFVLLSPLGFSKKHLRNAPHLFRSNPT